MAPRAFFGNLCNDGITWRLFPIPLPAHFGQFVIHAGAIGHEHVGKGASVLVLAADLERDILHKNNIHVASLARVL